MRYVNSTMAIFFALTILMPAPAVGQSPGTGLSITNYQLVSEERLTRTESNFTYRADLLNTGADRASVTATVTSKVPSVQVVPGRGTLHFSPVPANSQVPSSDTFTIKVDRTVAFDFASLGWTFALPTAPIANAGSNQTVLAGATATLNGSGSTNPSGVGTLTYSWAFTSRPAGSSATLATPASVVSTFVVDVPGTYVIALTVSNGTSTDTDSLTVSTSNSPPVAKAGPNQTVAVGSTVTLNGSASSDVDGNPLTYAWSLTSKPSGSTATLSSATAVSPTFKVDKAGTYIAQLIVNDGKVNSTASTITVTTQNSPPVAKAGPGQTVSVGALVQLDGSGSTDVDGDLLTYKWNLNSVPTGSTADLSSTTAVNPSFTVDRPGTYIAQLVVNDGKVNSAASTVTITTNAVQAPSANAGPNQTVKHGATVTLSGTGTDPQSLPLTLKWSLTTKPAGSAAVLSSVTAAHPTFVADFPGTYVAQLVVNNGFLNSTPDTVTITTTNTAPVAKAGSAQTVTVGTVVALNGSGSSDADGDPLKFVWSFTSRPSGSSATLSAASSPTPTFVADVAGIYVAQLIVSDPFVSSSPATVTITTVGVLAVTTSTLPNGTAGTPYSQTLGATGGKTPYTWALTSGALPAGLTLNTATGEIKGTPTTPASNVAFSVKVTDSSSPVRTATANLKLTIVAGSPAAITATSGTPQSTTIGAAFAAPFVVTVKDAGGNPVSGVTVTFTAPASGATGAFAGAATAVTNASGVATSNVFTANATAGSYNVTASVVGVAAPALFALTNKAGAAASIAATGGTPQTATISTAFAAKLIATVKDSGGNPVSGVTVTFAAPASGASGTFTGGATAVTNASGIATSNVFTANAIVGSYNVTASVPGVASPATFALTNKSGTAASISATAGTPQTTAIKTAFAAKLVATVKDSGGNPVSGVTVTFTAPASGASGTFTGGATAVTNASGVATSNVVTANAIVGSYNVTASVPGVATAATFALTNKSGAAASIAATGGTPQSAQITTSFAAKLVATVKDSGGNPVSGVTVTFTAPASGASGTFTGGATALTNASGVATSNVFTANATVGSYNVTASVPGVATPATFVLTNTPKPPASIAATGGTPQSTTVGTAFAARLLATVKDSGGNPVSGVTVTFKAPTSGASGTFSGGATAVTNASGVATSNIFTANLTAGSYNVTASVSGVATSAAFALTNKPVSGGAVTLTNATVGKGLQTTITLTLPQPAPVGGLPVTVSVNNTSLVKVSGRALEAGSGSISFTVLEGQTSVFGIYVQGQANSGSATVTATTPLGNATSTVTLAPSAFVLAGPSGPGVLSFTLSQGLTTPITVVPARLDASLSFAQAQQLSGGTSVVVDIGNSHPTVGSVTPASVTLTGGDSSATVNFKALLTGSTTMTASVPLGFSVPAALANTLTATVTPTGLAAAPVTVGRNLETTAVITFNGAAPSSGVLMTITSNDDSKVLLSKTANGAGQHSITLDVQGGRTSTQEFYIYGRAATGTGSYTAVAPGFGTINGTVNLRQSGFVINGPFGLGANFSTTPGAANSDLTIIAAMLDTSGLPVEEQAVQGGLTVNVPVTSGTPAVGTITTSPVTIAGGLSSAVTQFHPLSEGNSVITAGTPAGGFSTPAQSASLTAQVIQPALSVNVSPAIGRNLQVAATLLLGQPAPAGGLNVTITTDPNQMRPSSSPTTAGSATGSLIVNVPAGENNATFYLQARAGSGNASYTATAPGYKSRTGTVLLAPSAVLIGGPFGPGFQLTTTVAAGSQPVTVSTWLLDPSNNSPFEPQALAGGAAVSVALTNNNPGVGTVTSPIPIVSGNTEGNGQFTPLAVGQAVITVVQPAGFSAPSSGGTLTAKVN